MKSSQFESTVFDAAVAAGEARTAQELIDAVEGAFALLSRPKRSAGLVRHPF